MTGSDAIEAQTKERGDRIVEDVRIILSGIWVATMLTYLLGDLLRVYAGDFTVGEIAGQQTTPWMWFLAAVMMLIPIIMVVLSLTLPYPAVRWVTIVAVAVIAAFNMLGLPYPSAFYNFLMLVGFVFNGLIIRYAWTWT